MKKILILLFVLCAANSIAQTQVAVYNRDASDRDYKIYVSATETDSSAISDIYIQVDGDEKEDIVFLKFDDPSMLLSSLLEVRNQFAECLKEAEDNNITTKMSKEIPVTMPVATVCWYEAHSWFFAYDKSLKFDFRILSGTKLLTMFASVYTRRRIHQGVHWRFKSLTELDDFIEKLDYPKFIEILHQNPDNDKLFK